VRVKPDSKLSLDKVKAALATRNLSLNSQSNGVWQIGSLK